MNLAILLKMDEIMILIISGLIICLCVVFIRKNRAILYPEEVRLAREYRERCKRSEQFHDLAEIEHQKSGNPYYGGLRYNGPRYPENTPEMTRAYFKIEILQMIIALIIIAYIVNPMISVIVATLYIVWKII
jgi:hypothetical protein